jgi:hypothetical protein
MRTEYPIGAALGMTIIIVLQCIIMPALDERDAKRQQEAKVAQNKRLFNKLYKDAESMTFPIDAYPPENHHVRGRKEGDSGKS